MPATDFADSIKFERVSTQRHLEAILDRIGEGTAALDFETTSLTPAEGRVRLVSIANAHNKALVDLDQLGGLQNVAAGFAQAQWIVFNRGFEQRWFDAAGCQVRCRDVGNLRRAIMGGGSFSLRQLVSWDLDKEMSKEEQASDWNAPELTESQLQYAMLDGVLTWELYDYWITQADADHVRAWHLLDDMVPAVIEMEDTGIKLDRKRHAELCKDWQTLKTQHIKTIREYVTPQEVANLNSKPQWGKYFDKAFPPEITKPWPRTDKARQLKITGEALNAVAAQFPGTPIETLLDALAEYNTITKYLSSFGDPLINAARMSGDGRIRARFNIGYARTGRFSSSGPNVQQVPRDKELFGKPVSVRKSFVSELGRRLVSLDYSGIELRVLALLSGDEGLLHDVVYGDVHLTVASDIAGRQLDKTKDKALRSAAKGVSFGIIYGSGDAGLATTMRTSVEEAGGYIEKWRDRYPKAFDYRNQMMDEAASTRRIRMIDGGTVYMGRHPELPQCANYPVQRAALSVMARAITRHHETLQKLRARDRTHAMFTRMLATIHDAIIDEAHSNHAEQVLELMQRDMMHGYFDIFPNAPGDNLVEGGIGKNWSDLG